MEKSPADEVRTFSLAFEGSREEYPFGPDSAVFKAANGKIFAILSEHDDGVHVSLKLTPEEVMEAMSLPFVRTAPYLAKNHWVMPVIAHPGELDMTLAWIRRSHELVTARPARKRQ
ncbi:MAG: MmcQ/YjbR family DNA-binding protein [Dehalococcoidia bacterium]|nr:MmcQ/YjbR family DNA-binding protein [Dehalococcoidia bacterium]